MFPKAVSVSESHGFEDFLSLNTDQLYKTMWGALAKVIQDKETLESKVTKQQAMIQDLQSVVDSQQATIQSMLDKLRSLESYKAS